MNFVMRILRSGRSPLDFMFQKPSEICAAKRLIYNGPKNRVEVFGKDLFLMANVQASATTISKSISEKPFCFRISMSTNSVLINTFQGPDRSDGGKGRRPPISPAHSSTFPGLDRLPGSRVDGDITLPHGGTDNFGVTILGDSATHGPWCGSRTRGIVGVWIPWCGQTGCL